MGKRLSKEIQIRGINSFFTYTTIMLLKHQSNTLSNHLSITTYIYTLKLTSDMALYVCVGATINAPVLVVLSGSMLKERLTTLSVY